MAGSPFDVHKTEPSQQQSMETQPLDMHRAELSRQHEKFSDVVNWLKANAVKRGSFSALGSRDAQQKLVPESTDNQIKLFQDKTGFARAGTTASFAPSWSSGVLFSNQTPFFICYPINHRLSEMDKSIAMMALYFHPRRNEKIGPGAQEIKVGNHSKHGDSRCFIFVRTDGTVEDFSYHKCVHRALEIIAPQRAKTYQSRWSNELSPKAM